MTIMIRAGSVACVHALTARIDHCNKHEFITVETSHFADRHFALNHGDLSQCTEHTLLVISVLI